MNHKRLGYILMILGGGLTLFFLLLYDISNNLTLLAIAASLSVAFMGVFKTYRNSRYRGRIFFILILMIATILLIALSF
ncbi:MAG: hypothetical protein M3413_03915 [Bacteroidota bacterium]|nr:hypothetical protein [Bacteroidota bacterium]